MPQNGLFASPPVVPLQNNIPLPPNGYRTGLIGDSYYGLGFAFNGVATTAGTVVVKSGIATFTYTPGTGPLTPGSNIALYNAGDPTFSLAINGVNTPILSTPSNTTFTVSATYNGSTMANGDYSNPFGSGAGWAWYGLMHNTDSSHFTYHNAFNSGEFLVTNMSAFVGARTQDIIALMPKILAGPAFDIAWVNVGANDLGSGASSTVQQALNGAQAAFTNIQAICNQLISLGKLVILCIPAPVGTGLAGGSILNRNIGISQLRAMLIKWAPLQRMVRVIDVFKNCISGTAANGDFATSMGYTDGIHLASYGCYNIAKYVNQLNTLQPIVKQVDLSPVSAVEDGSISQSYVAWVANTNYSLGLVGSAQQSVPTIRRNAGALYALTRPGLSGLVGPTGTGSNIVDGQCLWTYAGVPVLNYIPNPAMTGSGGFTGVTGWSGTAPGTNSTYGANNSTGTPTVVSSVGTRAAPNSTGSQSIASAANSNQANTGNAWGLAITFSAANDVATGFLGGDISTLFAGGTVHGPAVGGWYRYAASFAVTGAVTAGCLKNLQLNLQFSGGTVTFLINAGMPGNNTTTLPLVSGDQLEIVSQPFYVPPGTVTSGGVVMNWIATGAAAGTVPLAISNPWVRQIENPYAETAYGI